MHSAPCPTCGAEGDQPCTGPRGQVWDRPHVNRQPRRTRLSGERHESVLTERLGQFRVICGCGWTSDFARVEDVERDHDAHLREVDRGE